MNEIFIKVQKRSTPSNRNIIGNQRDPNMKIYTISRCTKKEK